MYPKIIAVIDICVFASGDREVNAMRKRLYRDPKTWRDYIGLIPAIRDIRVVMGPLYDLTDFRLLSTQPRPYSPAVDDDKKEAIYNMRGILMEKPEVLLLMGINPITVYAQTSYQIPTFGTVIELMDPVEMFSEYKLIHDIQKIINKNEGRL